MTDAVRILEELRAVREELAEIKVRLAGPALPAAEPYVEPRVVMERFGISRCTLHGWTRREGCPHEMRGKILRFKLSEVEAWFAGRKPLRRVK